MRDISKIMENTNCKMEYYSLMRFRQKKYKAALWWAYAFVFAVLCSVTWMIRLLFTFPSTRILGAVFILTSAAVFWMTLFIFKLECKSMDKKLSDIKIKYPNFDKMLNVWERYQSDEVMNRNDLV